MKLVNIPSGFATFLGAVATLLAGFFIIIGAFIAWCSVQRQIRAAANIESARRQHEISVIEAGFNSELLVLSRSVIEATSMWNLRESESPDSGPITGWPIFSDPLYYKTNIGKIGITRQGWVGGALIGFYGNLLELNDQAREALSGRLTVNVTSQSIAERLRVMASNLSHALDGLNDDRKIPVPPDIDLNLLCAPKGIIFANSGSLPNNLQDVLLKLAGQP